MEYGKVMENYARVLYEEPRLFEIRNLTDTTLEKI